MKKKNDLLSEKKAASDDIETLQSTRSELKAEIERKRIELLQLRERHAIMSEVHEQTLALASNLRTDVVNLEVQREHVMVVTSKQRSEIRKLRSGITALNKDIEALERCYNAQWPFIIGGGGGR